jgi:hypothetical protein
VLLGETAPQAQIVVRYERDGSTYLENIGAQTLPVNGFQITSEFDDLVFHDYDGAKGWRALSDLESQFPSEASAAADLLTVGALSFGALEATSGGLSEASVLGDAVFKPGDRWFIGKPFANIPIDDAGNKKSGYRFHWKRSDVIDGTGGPEIIGLPVPEPSTLLLATLAGLGLVAMRVRSKRHA